MKEEKTVFIAPMPEDLKPCVWTEDAVQLVNERFLRKSSEGKIIETIEGMCWRVAYHIASADQKYGKTEEEIVELAKEFYDLMANRKFFPMRQRCIMLVLATVYNFPRVSFCRLRIP